MDKVKINTLLSIVSLALSIVGLILVLVSIFGETKNNMTLVMAFLAINLANLCNVIRTRRKRKEENSHESCNA